MKTIKQKAKVSFIYIDTPTHRNTETENIAITELQERFNNVTEWEELLIYPY